MIASCKTVVQYHNQDTDIDKVKTENSSITTGVLKLSIYSQVHLPYAPTPTLTPDNY